MLGIIAGALSAWLIIRLCVLRPKRQDVCEASLEPGPCYAPPSESGQEGMRASTQDSASLGDTSSHTAHSRSLLNGGWLGRAGSASAHRSKSHTRSTFADQPPQVHLAPSSARYATERHIPGEDDPFLDRSSSVAASSRSVERQRSATRSAAAVRSSGLSDEADDVPYDTLRHTSIRRGILERLKFGTLRRPLESVQGEPDVEGHHPLPVRESPTRRVSRRQGHRRKDSDLNLDDVDESLLSHPMPTPRRNNTETSENVVSPQLSGPGFRIIEEDTEADALAKEQCLGSARNRPNLIKDASSWTWLSPWLPSYSQTPAADSYTPMPARRNIVEKRSSPFQTPVASRVSTSTAPLPAMARIDCSILPSSPPRIMSPPLESKLFFGSVHPDFGSTPSLDLRLPSHGAQTRVQLAAPAIKQTNKLHTKREPPPLPFPSSSEASPYRNRLKKSIRVSPAVTTSPKSHSNMPPSRAASPSPSGISLSGRQTPAERYNARHSALDKVQAIVSQSWSQRDMSIDVFIASPTLFGALPADHTRNDKLGPDSSFGGGIEQRLGISK